MRAEVLQPPSPPVSGSKIAILGFPSDENSSYLKGAAEAPALIRAALFSHASNLWTENGTDLGAGSLLWDAGDVLPAEGEDPFACIRDGVRTVLEHNLKVISLGGDHAITYPIIHAVAKVHAALTILDFDAHPDLYDHFQGNRRSHACPFARIMEERLAERLVQVGIRTMNGEQRLQAERFGVEVIAMKDWRGVLPEVQSPVYISFDMDALDPAFAPGISHREPGGFSMRQALDAIQSIRAQVIGADIVEYNPRMDTQGVTAAAAAKLLKEIAAKMI
jgi:agmatinase